MWTVPSGSRPRKDRITIRTPPQTIAESARLKTAKCAGAMKSTTAPWKTPGRTEDPVGEVAERTAEQQTERDRPGQAVELARQPGDHHDHGGRDDGEDHGEGLADAEGGARRSVTASNFSRSPMTSIGSWCSSLATTSILLPRSSR